MDKDDALHGHRRPDRRLLGNRADRLKMLLRHPPPVAAPLPHSRRHERDGGPRRHVPRNRGFLDGSPFPQRGKRLSAFRACIAEHSGSRDWRDRFRILGRQHRTAQGAEGTEPPPGTSCRLSATCLCAALMVSWRISRIACSGKPCKASSCQAARDAMSKSNGFWFG